MQKKEGRRDLPLTPLPVHHLAAQSNLLLARLQRTRPFAAGAPVLFDLAPLLREATQWLRAVEQTLPLIPDPDLLPVLDNYDLLHRIVRHTPGTPFLRQAYHRILSNAAHLPLDQINAYVVDAYFKTCFSLSAANLEFRIENLELAPTERKDFTGGGDFQIPTQKHRSPSTGGEELQFLATNFQLKLPKILKSWSSQLPITNPSLLTPEQISRLRLILTHPAEAQIENNSQLSIFTSQFLHSLHPLTQNNSQFSILNSQFLHALLTLTVSQISHLSPKSKFKINYAQAEAIFNSQFSILNSEIQRALAQAPDNHPLDRAARRQLLANHKALKSPKRFAPPSPQNSAKYPKAKSEPPHSAGQTAPRS